jgi:hypothetical protein
MGFRHMSAAARPHGYAVFISRIHFAASIHAIFIVYTPFMHENNAEPREFSKAVRSERFSGSGNGEKQSAKFSLLLYTLFSRLF